MPHIVRGYPGLMHLNAVHDLVRRPGPFVTISAEVGRPTEDAPQQLDARWTTIRHALEHEGVGAGLIERIEQEMRAQPPAPGAVRRTLVAEGDELVLSADLAGESRWPETVEVDVLPDLAAYVAQGDRQLPFALVVADRAGADISFHEGLAVPHTDDTVVEGETFGITKVPEGDWAQQQYQRSAENIWRENAEDVADEVRRGLGRHRPRLVVLAGDVRARQLVADALGDLQSGDERLPVVHTEAGGRAAGASDQALWDDVRRILAEEEARRDAELVERLAEGHGRQSARGLDAVLDALVAGQVETLVVDLDRAREMRTDPADHPGLGLPEMAAGELPADRVLIAAAAATDADVVVLPAQQSGGSGVDAILRWA